MAKGWNDYIAFVEVRGEYEGEPVTVAMTADGDLDWQYEA